MRGAPFRPISRAALVEELAAWLAEIDGIVRVAVDGPPCAQPDLLAEALAEPLRVRGRPVVVVRADGFWRDASLRFEYGHEDVDALPDWLDRGALRREVLGAAVERGDYVPSLRDPATNRSTREPRRSVPPATVVIVSGAFLLSGGLPFDRSVHLAMSPAARARRTPAADRWMLPAFDRYDREVVGADVVVRLDDPNRPAVTGALG
jgi:hypothetical protein